jgi:hypothetical protein
MNLPNRLRSGNPIQPGLGAPNTRENDGR